MESTYVVKLALNGGSLKNTVMANEVQPVTTIKCLAMSVHCTQTVWFAPIIVFLVTIQPYLVKNLFILAFLQHARISDFCYS